MNKPLISILIPTVVGREEQYFRLFERINKLPMDFKEDIIHNGVTLTKRTSTFHLVANEEELIDKEPMYHNVQVLSLKDNKELTIGEKRELLYQQATGFFSWMIDDDDDIADNAIWLILEAIKSNPEVDVISFEEYCNMDGKEYKSNHSGLYSGWEGDGNSIFPDGFHFHRTPFFKSVIKTEIAKSVPIPHIRFGEDHQWAQALKPHLKTEIHIPEQLYRYIHISSDYNERYGIK